MALVAALAAVLLITGCGRQARLAPFPPVADIGPWSGIQWRGLSSTLSATLKPGSSNVCTGGTPSCMAAVVGEMTGRLDALASRCDHLAPFALMYRQVSAAVRSSVRRRRYHDPASVAHLDAVFATLYFHAVDAWRLGRHSEVPGAWQLAFSAAQNRSVSTLGDMMLGMNAHISRDLPYAIAAVGFREPDGADGTPDIVAVNTDISRAQAPMLRAIARRFDPSIKDVLQLARGIDPRTLNSVIAQWRLEAMRNARRLLAAHSDAAREHIETVIDANATVRGLLILRATEYQRPGIETKARDRFCAAQGAI